jgi:hypothetical protein
VFFGGETPKKHTPLHLRAEQLRINKISHHWWEILVVLRFAALKIDQCPQLAQEPPLQLLQLLPFPPPATTRSPLCAKAADIWRMVLSLSQFEHAIGASALDMDRNASKRSPQSTQRYS